MNKKKQDPYNNPDIEDLNKYVENLRVIIDETNHELIPILQKTQALLGFLPGNALRFIAKETKIPITKIYGVITFYNSFLLKPVGKYMLKVCCGTACHVAGAQKLINTLSAELNIPEGETTDDKMYTLESVACVGCCSLAPVIVVNKDPHVKLNTDDTLKLIRTIEEKEKNCVKSE